MLYSRCPSIRIIQFIYRSPCSKHHRMKCGYCYSSQEFRRISKTASLPVVHLKHVIQAILHELHDFLLNQRGYHGVYLYNQITHACLIHFHFNGYLRCVLCDQNSAAKPSKRYVGYAYLVCMNENTTPSCSRPCKPGKASRCHSNNDYNVQDREVKNSRGWSCLH